MDVLAPVLSPEILALAVAVGAVTQALKLLFGICMERHRELAPIKSLFALVPLLLGALTGWAFLGDTGVALHPAALGVVAGAISTTLYGLVKPALTERMQGRPHATKNGPPGPGGAP